MLYTEMVNAHADQWSPPQSQDDGSPNALQELSDWTFAHTEVADAHLDNIVTSSRKKWGRSTALQELDDAADVAAHFAARDADSDARFHGIGKPLPPDEVRARLARYKPAYCDF